MPVPLGDGRADLVKVRFNDYAIDRSKLPVNGGGLNEPIKIGADVTVQVNGKRYPHLQPSFMLSPGAGPTDFAPAVVTTPEGQHYDIGLGRINPDTGSATLSLATRNSAMFTVMHIPGIQVLWGGVYVMLLGAFLSYRRRAKLATRPVPSAKGARRAPSGGPAEGSAATGPAEPIAERT